MATTPRLFLANLLNTNPQIKSTLNEDPDMLEANLLIPSRLRFWRPSSATAFPATVNVDLQFVGSFGVAAAGVAALRAYRGGAGATQIQVYSGTGTTYPTITWTLQATIIPAAGDSNVFADISVSAKFWRFAITGSSQWGMKLWLVKTSDVVTLTQGAAGAVDRVRQLRGQERELLLGARTFNKGTQTPVREFTITLPAITAAQRDALITSQRGNVIYQHTDGRYYEVRHLADVAWRQLGGSTVLYSADLSLAEIP